MSEILVVNGTRFFWTQDNFEPNPFQELQAPFKVLDMTVPAEDILWLAEKKGMFQNLFPEWGQTARTLHIGLAKHPVIFEWVVGKEPKMLLRFKDKVFDVENVPFFFVRCKEVFTAERIRFFKGKKQFNCSIEFVGTRNLSSQNQTLN